MEYNNQRNQEQPGLIPGAPPPPAAPNKVGDPIYGLDPSMYSQSASGYDYLSGLHNNGSGAREYKICGLRASTFWLLLALVIVIVAAAVGGGVGGSLAVQNAKIQCLQGNNVTQTQSASFAAASASLTSSSAASSTTTSASSTTTAAAASSASAPASSSVPWGPAATSYPYTGCPSNNNTVYTTTLNPSKFQIICGLDIPYTGFSDLLYAITPTLELCIETCASWNQNGKSNGNATVQCKGVAFVPSHVNGDGGGNPIVCVLKSYATGLIVNPGYNVDSAILL